MQVSQAKENILKKIRQALSNPVPVPFAHSEGAETVFQPLQKELEIAFAENFTSLQGKFSYCGSEKELVSQLTSLVRSRNWKNVFCIDTRLKDIFYKNDWQLTCSEDLESCDLAITGCENLIARTGSIVLSAKQPGGRTTSVYAPVHICIAYTGQLVYDIREALVNTRDRYTSLPSLITLATGPSRTADIEKTLVVGVHGPREVFCFLVESNE